MLRFCAPLFFNSLPLFPYFSRKCTYCRIVFLVAGPSIAALYPPRVVCHVLSMPRPRERQAAGWLLHCPLRVGGREIKICSAPLSEQHSSAGLDAAAQRRKKGRKCLFRRFPVKPGRPGGKRLLGRRTSISGPATTERGSLRAHLAELVAGPSIAALYPPRVGLPCAILPRPRERQAAGWLLHCPLQSSQHLSRSRQTNAGCLSFSHLSNLF